MRLVRTIVAITFDHDDASYTRDTLVPGVLCEARFEDEREATLRPVGYPHLVARVAQEAFKPANPLQLLAEQAE
jgi:hypothetical protein